MVDHDELKALAPTGYYIAVRMGFVFPAEEHNALPEDWVRHYTSRGFMLRDPVLRWVYAYTGAISWAELSERDPFGVLDQARSFGLQYGVAISHLEQNDEGGLRSFGSFVRADREFTEDEIARLHAIIVARHKALDPPRNLTDAELEALSMARDGLLLKEIAHRLGVSEGAIKQRLKSAKTKLDARNSTHAITKATQFGLI